MKNSANNAKQMYSNKNFQETRDIYSQNNHVEILMDTDNILDELFKSLLQRFQDAKEKSNERRSEFIQENVDLLYYILHKKA